MRHFLAYGNSDQASFRDPQVRNSLDYMTVPGTIAAYYPEATAAFVLSSELQYMIDPRTPLFQGVIASPRASHYQLAAVMGQSVRNQMGDQTGGRVQFAADFYSAAVIAEVVEGVIGFQREYGSRADQLHDKLSRYQQLLALARGELVMDVPAEVGPRPDFILAPYFFSGGEDEWAEVNDQIAMTCAALEDAHEINPVIAVLDPEQLAERVRAVPDELSPTRFFWVDGFEERTAPVAVLTRLWDAVAELHADFDLINLYGGFYSICLHYAGLWGFSNGLGYSESRDWPELPSTGAAPPRYYVPRLHTYVSQLVGQVIADASAAFRCRCPVCLNKRVVELSYHDLKRHFALARRDEIELVTGTRQQALAGILRDTAREFEDDVMSTVPPGLLRTGPAHLNRWADVLRARP